MYYVYILENLNDKSWYIGYSSNLKERVNRHEVGNGARTTKRKHNWSLVYYEAYRNKLDAKGRELFLKSGGGRRYIKKQLAHYLEN